MSFVLWVVVLCASSPHVGPGSSGYLPTASTQQALEQMHNKQEIGGYSNLFTLTCGVVMHVVSGSRESRISTSTLLSGRWLSHRRGMVVVTRDVLLINCGPGF